MHFRHASYPTDDELRAWAAEGDPVPPVQDVVAKESQFDIKRSIYDSWLNVARGAKDPAVKRWRHEARLVLQGLKPFDSDEWWERWSRDIIEPE